MIQITKNTTSIAIVRQEDNKVLTFIRMDYPEGWEPEEGYYAIGDDLLPEGWERIPPEPEKVPDSVTATQIRLWLVTHGISLQSIESAIDSIEDQQTKDIVRVQWEYAPYVERKHFMMDTLGIALGFSTEQIDNAFIEASKL
jgi:hypothetical protein